MRDLLPLRELLIALSPSIGVDGKHPTTFKKTVHKDNAGALGLANLEPGRLTSRSKQYAVKLHWFRSKFDADVPHPIHVVKIATEIQKSRHPDERIVQSAFSSSSKTVVRVVTGDNFHALKFTITGHYYALFQITVSSIFLPFHSDTTNFSQ
jgi:hypothetical protein